MIVLSIAVACAGLPGVWTSSRYLLREDGVGFTMTQTTVAAGQSQTMEYKNHVEANLIIEGEATLTDITNDKVYELGPGSMYTLDGNERHRLEARTDLRIDLRLLSSSFALPPCLSFLNAV